LLITYCTIGVRLASREEQPRNFPLPGGAITVTIIPLPPKISAGCGPDRRTWHFRKRTTNFSKGKTCQHARWKICVREQLIGETGKRQLRTEETFLWTEDV